MAQNGPEAQLQGAHAASFGTTAQRDSTDALGNSVRAPAAPRPATVSIHDLPLEILVDIFALLSPAELKDLRLVCRRWNYAALDKAVWTRAFRNRFGTGDSFASVTRLPTWLAEYFGRVARTRLWTKAKARTHLYLLVNSQFGSVEFVEADFVHDRLMTFSRVLGSLALCALVLGKNQVFIPENLRFTRISAYDASYTHLCVGTAHGLMFVKNLITATAASLNRLSVVHLLDPSSEADPSAEAVPPERVVLVRVRRAGGSPSVRGDIATVDVAGKLCVWTVAGEMLRRTALELLPGEAPVYMTTDFLLRVWVVTSHAVRIVLYSTLAPELTVAHGAEIDTSAACHVDFGGDAVAIAHDASVRVVRADPGCDTEYGWSVVEARLETPVVHSALQHCATDAAGARASTVAGGDGRLLAVAMADGSAAVYNIRARGPLRRQCHILPFSDARAPRGLEAYTKVAVDSSVVAVAVAAGWVHFYDSHLGRYLREGAAVTRRLTRNGVAPVLAIQLGPGALGVVVCGDVVQHFSYGDAVVAKRPSTPQAVDTALRRARQHAIRAQMDDWDLSQHHQHQSEMRADKFNGTAYESEQDELRMAMALSASYHHRAEDDDELALALEMLRQAQAETAATAGASNDESLAELAELADLEYALEMLRHALESDRWAALEQNAPEWTPLGALGPAPSTSPEATTADEDELLRRAIELLLTEH